MKRVSRIPNRSRGFSLVELSIVLIVLGIIISIGFKLLPNLVNRAEATKNTTALERARDALVGFAATHHRLPCPAATVTGANAGQETLGTFPLTCANAVGYLPYNTLGLTDGLDAYKRPLRYGVTTDYTTSTTARGNDGNADLAYQWGSSANFCQAISNAGYYATDYSTNTDHVYVYNTFSGLTPAPAVTAADHQAFVVASAGYADMNRDGDFFDGGNSGALPLTRTVAQEFESPLTMPNANYDDQVLAESFNKLSGLLNCGNALQQNALAFATSSTLSGTTLANASAYSTDISVDGGLPGSYSDNGTTYTQYEWCADSQVGGGVTLSADYHSGGVVATRNITEHSGTYCQSASESNWVVGDYVTVSAPTASA